MRRPLLLAASSAVALAAVLQLWPSPARACLWDTDTLAQERSRFPSTLELITGKFPRHSDAFYKWRLRDRRERLDGHPDDLSTYNDLAVAHDKLGHHDRAIEWMHKKRERLANPDLDDETRQTELYRTLANLGTFYLHAGNYERGIEFIDRALIVNPEAHFGRERYQKYLAEYLLERGPDRRPVGGGFGGFVARRTQDHPCHAVEYAQSSDSVEDHFEDLPGIDFEELLDERMSHRRCDTDDSEGSDNLVLVLTGDARKRALKGVKGMMRFGDFRSPVLLEALGDLLLKRGYTTEGAARLAARAYLMASRVVDDPKAADSYRERAAEALSTHQHFELENVESRLDTELAEARAWFETLQENEQRWIEGEADPDERFRATYLETYWSPRIESTEPWFSWLWSTKRWLSGLVGSEKWVSWIRPKDNRNGLVPAFIALLAAGFLIARRLG